jgi:hypothetical protein
MHLRKTSSNTESKSRSWLTKKKDTILDGRNRIMAAHDLKLKDSDVPIEVFTGNDGDEVSEIVSRNIMRRNLTDDQRVAIVAKLRSGLKSTQGRAREVIAAEAKVGDYKARAALEAAKHAPKDLDRVIEGKEKLADAKKRCEQKRVQPRNRNRRKAYKKRVEAKFLRFMESFAVTQYRAVREILRELLKRAQQASGETNPQL